MAIELENSNQRRRRNSTNIAVKNSADWSQLFRELHEHILSKLSFINILRFQAVCSSWNSISKSFISSSRYSPSSHPPLLLVLPNVNRHKKDGRLTAPEFLSIEGGVKFLKIKNPKSQLENDSRCIASYHGWLLFSNKEKLNLTLVNPFSGSPKIDLPPLYTFPIQFKQQAILKLHKFFLSKVAVWGELNHDKDFGVVVIFGHSYRLAFFKNGNCAWKTFVGASETTYYDIMLNKELLYAFTEDLIVEIWDLSRSSPLKSREIRHSISRQLWEVDQSCKYECSYNFYLVESSEDLLLIVRRIKDLNGDDDAALSDKDLQLFSYPYRTEMFHVFKLDICEKKWLEVQCLGNRVLFLGGNNSSSMASQGLLGLEGNTIYFTDDNWISMDEHLLQSAYDHGKFNLQEKVVRPLLESESKRIHHPAFWVFPNPR